MEKKHLFSLRSLPIGKILLLFLLIYIALLAIPYIQHKNVSVSYQKKFAKQSFYSDTAGTERVAYINDNIILEVAYTEKGTVTKASVAYALAMARAEAPAPEAYADDYAEFKATYELAKKSEDSTKLIKEMDKELDEKARERYATLTDDEIMDLLVNKKWYYTIGTGINDLYAAISYQLANRIIELSKRYENTLPDLMEQTADYEAKVKSHLERMGFKW